MNAQRGQAIFETVIFMPLFLLALFGIMWAVQAGVQFERVESAVRYAGLISQRADPYLNYSFYSLYTQLNSTSLPQQNCVLPTSDTLTDAAPTYNSAQTVTASPPFWAPAGGVGTPSCASPDPVGILGVAAGTGLTQDLLLSEQYPSMTVTINVPPVLQSALGGLSSSGEAQRFFSPVGINTILACYPTMNAQIDTSINYNDDTASPTAPAALGTTITPIAPPISSNCTTF